MHLMSKSLHLCVDEGEATYFLNPDFQILKTPIRNLLGDFDRTIYLNEYLKNPHFGNWYSLFTAVFFFISCSKCLPGLRVNSRRGNKVILMMAPLYHPFFVPVKDNCDTQWLNYPIHFEHILMHIVHPYCDFIS